MYIVNVCCGKVTLLHASVCASTYKVCIFIIVLRSHVIIKAFFVTQFKICLQYDFIWWVLPPVGAAIGVLGVAV